MESLLTPLRLHSRSKFLFVKKKKKRKKSRAYLKSEPRETAREEFQPKIDESPDAQREGKYVHNGGEREIRTHKTSL